MEQQQRSYTAFEGFRRIASGEPAAVAAATKGVVDRGAEAPVLVFDDATGQQVELDLRGSVEEVRARLAAGSAPTAAAEAKVKATGPGRPRLGVVGREVTLLPRHWEWLGSQPGGASVALRKLVDQARRANESADRIRRAQEAAYRFMSAMAGNLPGFEEAARALFAPNPARFAEMTAGWPTDVAEYARRLAAGAWGEEGR